MDYLDLFRPILSLAMHITLANSARRYGIAEAKTALADLHLLIGDAFAHRRPGNSRDFDQAWFPVQALMEEKLSGLLKTAGNDGAQFSKEYTPCRNSGDDFFTRLDTLLVPREGIHKNRDRIAILDVYRSCLELGFRGRYNKPESASELAGYGLRCRKAKMEADGERPASALRMDASSTRVKKTRSSSMAVFWAIPLFVTLGLFFLYRLILADLFNQVVG